MTTVTFSIPGISCNHCVHTIKTEVGEMPGVSSVDANPENKQATVSFDDPATEDGIRALLTQINYPAA